MRPDNPLAQAPYLHAPYSLIEPSGVPALNAEVTRQAAMVGYNDDFALMVVIAALPTLLLIRPSRPQPVTATTDD